VNQNNSDLGEQALSKIAEVGISSQLDAVEALDVDIKTDSKLIQGELESVEIAGKGMVMQNDLRIEEMNLQTGNIAIDPLRAVFGSIELTRPTEATAEVTLTESDINRAFNSDYIGQKLQNLDISVGDRSFQAKAQNINFSLPSKDKVALEADILLSPTGESKQVAFSAIPRISPDGQAVSLENIDYKSDSANFSSQLTDALLDRTSELLNLANFELPGIDLKLKQIKVETGKMTLVSHAVIKQFLSSK
jgi:hypothetical protein